MPLLTAGQYPIWANALIFAAAALVVWRAGGKLARCADEIAERTGLGHAVAGMMLLGGVSALPEAANCVTAAAIDNPTLAANNLFGSVAINLLLLAMVDAVFGRGALTSFVAGAATLMQAALAMILLALIAVAITVGEAPILGVGVWTIAICLTGVGAFWLSARYERVSPWAPSEASREDPEDGRSPPSGTAPSTDGGADAVPAQLVAQSAVTALLILACGYALGQTGDALAQQTGIGSGMVGFVLMGLSTSLPELSTITAAVRMGRQEMAIGQVLGSITIYGSLFLLIDAVYAGGPLIDELGRFETVSALLGVTLTGMFLVGLLERRDPAVLRMGYDSLAVILLFVGGVALLFAIR